MAKNTLPQKLKLDELKLSELATRGRNQGH